jgi:NADH-quinone oxidoreductase subunit L
VSHIPFFLGIFGALLTAFYMTRQVALVFFGTNRAGEKTVRHVPHESPRSMTLPLIVLAACAIGLSVIGTPAWPWFHAFLSGHSVEVDFGRFSEGGFLPLMALSSSIVLIGIGLGWWLYGRKAPAHGTEPDPLERLRPDIFHLLQNKYWIDEVYGKTVIAFNAWWARACDFMDAWVWSGLVQLAAYVVLGVSWLSRVLDEYLVNPGFDESCRRLRSGGNVLSKAQNGVVQNYLRTLGISMAVLVLLLMWGCQSS